MSALQPLPDGLVLIVGAKSSNFDDEIKTHPRIVIWDSQQKHWTNKDLPQNTRAVFMTRFIGHQEFSNIVSEARKRKITIFNPEGTGLIVKQVKELLNMNNEPSASPSASPIEHAYGKLKPLIQHIDFKLSNVENARRLIHQATALGINTTEGSLSVFVANQRKQTNEVPSPNAKSPRTLAPKGAGGAKLDLSVEILDNAIKELKDMREFLIATVKENNLLKTKLAKFKSLIED